MKYIFMLFLCFLSRTAIGQPTIKLIGTNSSTSCGNFTSLDGNFQSVTFEVTGDWGDSNLDRFNTPQVENQDGTVICLMVIGQGDCTVQTILYHTCTCENKTGGVYHFTVTSSPSTPLADYQMIMTWTNVPNVVQSDGFFSVQEVRNETCPCKVNKLCIAINWAGVAACFCVLAVLYYICCKKYEHKTARIVIFVVGLVVCIAVFIGFILCLTVKKCLTTSEQISAAVGIIIVKAVLFNFFILLFCKCGYKTKVISKEMDTKSDQPKHGTIENILDFLFKKKKRNKVQGKQHRKNTQVQDLNEECTPTTQSDLVKLKSNKQEGAGQGKLKKKEQLGRISDGNVNDNNVITNGNVYDNVDDNDGNVNDNNGNTDGNVYDNVDDNDGTNEDNSDTCNNNDSQLKAQKSSSGNKPRRLSPLKSSSPRPLPVPGGEKPDTYVSTSLSNQSGLPMNVQYSSLHGKISKKSRPPSIEVPSKQNI